MEPGFGGSAARPSAATGGDRARIALLRSDEPQHVYLEARLARDLHLVGVVVEPGDKQQARFRSQRQWSGWLWRVYHRARRRLTGLAAYRREYFDAAKEDLGATQGSTQVERITVDWINNGSVRSFLERLKADIAIVCGTVYIRQDSLAGISLAINVHNGYLPYYKGNHGIFFALENSDFQHIGVSLHVVNEKLDSGPLIAIECPEVFPRDNEEILYCRAFLAAVDLLCETVGRFEQGYRIETWDQAGAGRAYRHRDRTPYRELRQWALRATSRRRAPRLGASRVLRFESPELGHLAERRRLDEAAGDPLLLPVADEVDSRVWAFRGDC